MSTRTVELVEVLCDGCDSRMEYGDGEYTCWKPDQISEWVCECDWREEDGKHYCCGNGSSRRGSQCWPSSLRDEE